MNGGNRYLRARATALGKAALTALRRDQELEQLRRLRRLGFNQWAKSELARKYELRRIDDAPPIASSTGAPEVHMLLHHARIREGAWAMYSLAYYAASPLAFVVHDDGSLTDGDRTLLDRVLPGCSVIARERSDAMARERLSGSGYARCQRLRDELVFGLKLFDPFFFAESETFFLIDSDVLFVSRPAELFPAPDQRDHTPLYSLDNGYRYCIDEAGMRQLMGRECIPRFNPGVVRAHRGVLSLERCERHLAHPGFWRDGKADYYAELTMWAMELTHAGARPLPETYAICPDFRAPFVSGHYCGGGYWSSIYYSDILPQVARAILGVQ